MTLSNNEKPRGSCWKAFGFVAVLAAVVVMAMMLPNGTWLSFAGT
jgi:hypothetical protein